MHEKCIQPDICAERFKGIDQRFNSGSNRMTRIEKKLDDQGEKTDKILLRITALALSLVISVITISDGYHQFYHKPLQDALSKIVAQTDRTDDEPEEKKKPALAFKDG